MKPLPALLLALASVALASIASAAISPSEIESEVDGMEEKIRTVAMELWNHAETALREDDSAKVLQDWLAEEGFAIESEVANMPTAFVATWGSGKPVLGVLAEYDALPSVGNAAVPEQKPREDDLTTGHGCGHNLFGAGSTATAVALKRVMERHGVTGTLKLFGCPAEETLVGKVYMAKAGVFDGLDACLDWHPSLSTRVSNRPDRAMNNFEVEFFGKSAHGSVDPWNGRSALDGLEAFTDGVNMMREHLEPTSRNHYVITHGGDAPNVVPKYAKLWMYTRDADREKVDANYAWILDIAKGAALATQTEYKVNLITGVHKYNLNRPLQEVAQKYMELVGPPSFTEDETDFAKTLQRNLGLEEVGYDTEIPPLAQTEGEVTGGSTDAAEVSRIAPTVNIRVTSAAKGIPWHSWAAAACHGTSAAPKAAIVAAKILAMTGIEILTDPDLLVRAKADFQDRTNGEPYQSPLPLGQKPPLPQDVSG